MDTEKRIVEINGVKVEIDINIFSEGDHLGDHPINHLTEKLGSSIPRTINVGGGNDFGDIMFAIKKHGFSPKKLF